MKIDDLLVCDDFSQIYANNIIIYGTGVWGRQVFDCLRALRKDVQWVCNTDEKEDCFCGLEIKSLKWIKENYDRNGVLIIIASTCYWKDMIGECEKLDFKQAKICTLYGFFISLRMHRNDIRIPDEFRKKMLADLEVSEKRVEYFGKIYTLESLALAADESSDKILVYQPGKVGSRSIMSALGEKGIHFHTLMSLYGCEEFDSDLIFYYHQKLRNKKIKIITSVREPIARDLSGFFQGSDLELWPFSAMNNHLILWYGDYHKNNVKLDDKELKRRMPRWEGNLNDTFCKAARIICENKLDEFTWFDYEIKQLFDIDVYQYPFDKKKGYTIIKKNNTEILILKLEQLLYLENVISVFAGNSEIYLSNRNEGQNKLYSYTYKELKNKIRLDREYFEYYYGNNDKLKHFYSDDEINEMKAYWEKHIII